MSQSKVSVVFVILVYLVFVVVLYHFLFPLRDKTRLLL